MKLNLLNPNKIGIAVALLAAAFGCGGGEPASEQAAAPEQPAEVFDVNSATAGVIVGKVAFDGEAPKPQRLNLSADEDCKQLHPDGEVYSEQVVVNDDGALKNVYVWVKSGLEGKQFAVPSTKVHLDQEGCIYKPHVVGIQVGQILSVTNSDPTSHNVHPLPRSNVEWNMSQSANAGAIEKTFDKPELMIPVKCNLHPWMRAYVNVSPHPFFAVTGDDGSFELKGVPPGEYTVEAVHERYGVLEVEVEVGEGETAAADFAFKG